MSGTGVSAENIENRLWHLKRNGLLKNNSVQKITTAWAMGSENQRRQQALRGPSSKVALQ